MEVYQYRQVEPIRKSVAILVVKLVLLFLQFDAAYLIVSYALSLWFNLPYEWHHHINVGLLFFYISKNIVQLYFILSIVLSWANQVYYFTDKHIVERKGIINIKEKIYDLKIIRSVSLQQGLIGKILSYGDIIITTSASGGYNDEISILGISKPEKYKDMLKHCLEITT